MKTRRMKCKKKFFIKCISSNKEPGVEINAPGFVEF